MTDPNDRDLTGAQLDAYFAQCLAADKIGDLAQELSRETRVEKVRGIVAEIGLLCAVCIEKAAFISGENDG